MALECVFPTELGFVGLAIADGKIEAVTFGHSNARVASLSLRQGLGTQSHRSSSPRDVTEADERLAERATELVTQFAQGEPVDLQSLPLATSHYSTFQLSVMQACRQIPWSETRSYGELAAEVGHPGAARAVGTVMSRNRYPLIVPCHRVLGSGGRLGGYSAPQGLAMKRRLLDMEAGALMAAR